jgi:hypothetical protein
MRASVHCTTENTFVSTVILKNPGSGQYLGCNMGVVERLSYISVYAEFRLK